MSRPELRSKDLTREILEEIRALRAVVAASAPASVRAADADADLESAVDSMRRLLSEYQERRTDQWLQELAAIRETIADPLGADPAEGLRRIDLLFDRLGAIPFSARYLDFVDPAIHEVAAERSRADIPDGVVVETLRPGLRGGGGGLICRARVAVNRRGLHEPAGH
jgi:hypothetical protein